MPVTENTTGRRTAAFDTVHTVEKNRKNDDVIREEKLNRKNRAFCKKSKDFLNNLKGHLSFPYEHIFIHVPEAFHQSASEAFYR